MKVSEEIRATKELLIKEGWVQGDFVVFDGEDDLDWKVVGRCVYGALGRVQHDDEQFYNSISGEGNPTARIIMQAIPECNSSGHMQSIVDFNDMPGRQFDEVCDVLDKAEKLALTAEEEQL